jgi:hypothetical protein
MSNTQAPLERLRGIAPPAPPCFETRLQWLEYLAAACNAKTVCRESQPGPLKGAALDPAYNFCADCTQGHQVAMMIAGKCRPNWWRIHVMQREAA